VKTPFILLILAFALSTCGGPFDILGKGAKTKCFYLDLDSLHITYNCDARKISAVTVYDNVSRKESFGKVMYNPKLDQPVSEITLPFSADSLRNKFIQVELYLTDSHPRESYYIDISPEDWTKRSRIYARYVGH
jgi:hypothetical protein